jgi:hypothetical protein
MQPPEYPLVAAADANKFRRVAVFVAADPGTEAVVPGAEATLASDLSRRLPELAMEAWTNPKLTVLDPVVVDKFKLKTPDWKLMFASDCGRQLGADIALVVHLHRVSLYQPGSQERLYEGRADVTVDVFEAAAGPAAPRYHYELPFRYPRTGPMEAARMPVHRFRREFLDRLATEIALKHVPHRHGYEGGEEGKAGRPPLLP